MIVYKILIMEQNNMINIDVYVFDKCKNTTDLYRYHITDELKRAMMLYIRFSNYRLIYDLLKYYIIDNHTLQYDQECLICISTKEYTFNFTLNEIKCNNSSL